MSKVDIFFVLIIVIIISLIFNFTSLGTNLLNIMHLGKYLNSLKIFSILVIAVPFSIYFGTYQGILQGVGKTRDLSLIVIIGSILYVVGSPVLIKYFGVFGAAIMFGYYFFNIY
jgi:O-antigen/teichoic acid export membrane protein